MGILARAKTVVVALATITLTALIVSGSAVAANAADTASISGAIRAGDGAPIAGATATLYSEEDWGWGYVRSTTSDAAGAYTFSGLPADGYKIAFTPADGQNYLPEWFDDQPTQDAATALTIAAGEKRTGIDATLAAGATISGNVTTTYLDGGPSEISAACAFGQGTDIVACDFDIAKDGAYRIVGLPAGSYKVSFGGQGGCGEYPVGAESLWTCNREVFWPGKPSAKSATVLTLTDQQQRTGVDQNFDVAAGTLIYPKITGTAAVGKTLTAARGSWESGTRVLFQWEANGTPISGANSSTFTLTASQVGKTISVHVFGRTRPAVDGAWYDTWESTGWTMDGKVAAGTLSASKPVISGTVAVGGKLTVKRGTWSSGTSFTYRWYANGSAISKATGSSFTVTKSQAGKKITVKVTGAKKGYTSRSVTSAATAKVMTVATPKISGTAAVGKKLTAKPGAWTSGTKFTYQWYADGKAIKKATKSTLTLSSSQRGKVIKVKVTGKKSGYATVTKTSKATSRVR